MQSIYLPSGDVCLVSDEDYNYLRQFNWSAAGSRGNPYAARWDGNKRLPMHYEVIERMGQIIPDRMEPDHEDRNTFNNQRTNLRIVTKSINRHNTNLQHNNTSGVRGVKYNKRNSKWQAQINVNGVRHHLGYFSKLEEAEKARKEAEKHYVT